MLRYVVGLAVTATMLAITLVIPARHVSAATPVNLALVPVTQTITVGSTFDVIIQAQSGAQPVVGVQAYLNFDPTKLVVVGGPAGNGSRIAGGTALPTILENSVDNALGQINFGAGKVIAPYPSGNITVATISFQAIATTSLATSVMFPPNPPVARTTKVTDDTGINIVGTLTGGSYTIVAATATPPPTTAPASPTPTPTTPVTPVTPPPVGGTTVVPPIVQPVGTSGFSSSSDPLRVDLNTGIAAAAARLKTDDASAVLDVAQGTRLSNSAGGILATLTVSKATAPPAPPPQKAVVLTYDLGPNGARFDPPLTLTLKFTASALPAGVAAKDLVIAYWDGKQWQTLPSTVNTTDGTISAQTAHFTQFAILGALPPPSAVVTPTSTPSQTPTPTTTLASPAPSSSTIASPLPNTPSPSPNPGPPPTTLVIGGPPSSSFNWVPVIVAVVIVVGILTLLLLRRKRRKS